MTDIKVYLSDLADSFIPPYNTPREKLIISSNPLISKESWEEEGKHYKRYFLAGGGNQIEFDVLWAALVNKVELKINAWKQNEYCTAGGEVLYLISGIKK